MHQSARQPAPSTASQATAGLLLLADGRLPAGGYAHSAGLEPAIGAGRVRSMAELEQFLIGRVTTTGTVNAAFAAAACAAAKDASSEQGEAQQQIVDRLAVLDAELDARTPSPALREVAQTLGRQLLRALQAVSPHPLQQQLPRKINHPIAFGAAAAMLDLTPVDAARGVLHETVSGPASAVVKLMSADPFDAYRIIAGMRELLDAHAQQAAEYAHSEPEELPAYGAPVSDVLAEAHQAKEVRLFAS